MNFEKLENYMLELVDSTGGFALMDTENRLSITFLTHCLTGNTKLDQFNIRDLTYESLLG